ncbi:MAG: rhodanese-like domain-containing protein [Methylococcaceae bacterium]
MNSILRNLLLVSSVFFCSPLFAEGSGEWEAVEAVDGAETISLAQAKVLHAEGVKFIDVRSSRQFNKRHIPGASHLYIKDSFTEVNLLELVKKDEPLIVYCNGARCSLSSKAATKAVAWGFTKVKYYREGFRAWRKDGNPLEYGAK